MKFLTIVIALLFYIPAFAGGPSWRVKIEAIELLGDTAILKLRNVDDIYEPFQVCDPLVVIASYKGEPWYQWTKTWSDHTSRDTQKVAIDYLLKAQQNDRIISFGYIGTGIVPENKRNICRVVSRALIKSGDGVVSLHDPA